MNSAHLSQLVLIVFVSQSIHARNHVTVAIAADDQYEHITALVRKEYIRVFGDDTAETINRTANESDDELQLRIVRLAEDVG
jgi:phage-related baseplate assembly protein